MATAGLGLPSVVKAQEPSEVLNPLNRLPMRTDSDLAQESEEDLGGI